MQSPGTTLASGGTSTTAPFYLQQRLLLRTETLALLASLYFALAGNRAFWRAALHDQPLPAHWLYATCVLVFIVALQYILLVLLLYRWTARPLLAVIILLTAATSWFADRYCVYMDAAMVRNVLATDWHEARELLSWQMTAHLLLHAGLPLLLLSRIQLRNDPPSRRWLIRPVSILVALLVAVAAVWPIARTWVPLVREKKELRYLLAPGNFIYGLARVLTTDSAVAATVRKPIGSDARRMPANPERPVLLLIVVGETVRAANWGLNGYARQTTPELAGEEGVINFRDVESCGTNTETSLPCMFSATGRHDYDEQQIRSSESLLHVLDHAGVNVLWRDNQSGCKGICEGLAQETPNPDADQTLCNGERCFDEILLRNLDPYFATGHRDQVIVLHTLGNHGPAYYQRYPTEFRHFLPTCDTSELGHCTTAQIINSYDNAILYTDHLLAQAIHLLRSHAATHDTALIYLSDHGESLGEGGIYLHSMPRVIAPDYQTKVPMTVWLSPQFAATEGIDASCLQQRAEAPASHDHLFHTVLGLLDIQTSVYDAGWDLTAGCRQAPPDNPR